MKSNVSNTLYRSHIYRSIIALVVGLVILFMPYDTLNSLVVMIGCFVLLAGVGSAVSAYRSTSSFFSGLNGISSIVSIALGGLCIIKPSFFVDVMVVVMGIIMTLIGALQLYSVKRISYEFKRSAFYYPGGIATLLAGLFLVFFPKSAINIVGVVLGIVLVVYALNEAGISYRLYHISKKESGVEDVSFEEIE